jgi:thiamine pyrophosphokinase
VAVVFAAAPLVQSARLKSRLAALEQPYVVAADGGAATALAFGMPPDVVVGDLDSIRAPVLADLKRRGVPVETHPRDKNATDGQLAIERALLVQPASLWLLGFLGGPRLDQALAHVFFLARLGVRVVMLDERNECTVVLPGAELTWPTEPGEVVSLIPLAGEVTGVRTHGLRWPLNAERLQMGDTRGVSNEPNANEARISIERGLLLVTRYFPDP